jgi:hypothetical protein
MTRATALIAATLLSTLGLAACGGSSSGLLPTTNAATIGDDLSSLSEALSTHDCDATQGALNRIFSDLSNLPASVDSKLRANLEDGFSSLDNTARVQCHATSTTHTHTHSTGSTGTSQTTSSTSGTTGPTGTTTSTGPTQSTSTTGPTQSTSPTGPTIGPGGGSQAPGGTGNSGTTDNGSGGAASDT